MRAPEPRPDSLKAYFLEANPNPERIDCPPESVVQAAAENRVGAEHPVRLHLASCSECYAEFRGYKLDWEEQRRARMRVIGWAAAAVLIIGIVGGIVAIGHSKRTQGAQQEIAQTTPPNTPSPDGDVPQKPPQNPPVAVDTNPKTDHPPDHPHSPDDGSVRLPKHTSTPTEPHKPGDPTVPANPSGPNLPIVVLPSVLFDLSKAVPVEDEGSRGRGELQGLTAATQNLTLRLPDLSGIGKYEIRLAKDKDGQNPVGSARGTASLSSGKIFVHALLKLEDVEPGNYYLVTIHDGDAVTHTYAVRVEPRSVSHLP